MRKLLAFCMAMVLPFIMLIGCSQTSGCETTPNGQAYTQCTDARGADSNGWVSKYDFESYGLDGITTLGLKEQGNDYSILYKNKFEVELFEDTATPMRTLFTPLDSDFIDTLSSCVKMKNVSIEKFEEYCNYLFNAFEVNKKDNGQLVGSYTALIRGFNNNPLGIKAKKFEGFYLLNGGLKPVVVFYFQEGFTQIVQELDMYIQFPMEQETENIEIKRTLWKTDKLDEIDESAVYKTWPMLTELAFGNLGDYNNIPSIYQPYYLVWDLDAGINQVFVPNYTTKMEEFYHSVLKEKGFNRVSNLHYPYSWISWFGTEKYNNKNIPCYELKETPVTSWFVSFAENNGFLQISAILNVDWAKAAAYGNINWSTSFQELYRIFGK